MPNLIINAGGRSKRIQPLLHQPILGKAWLTIENIPILVRNLNEFIDHVEVVIIVVKEPEKIPVFQSQLDLFGFSDSKDKIKIVAEIPKTGFSGPTCGIFTGLHFSRTTHLWFISCDHPYVNVSLFKRMTNLCNKKDMIVSIQNKSGEFDPNLFVIKREFLEKLKSFVGNHVTHLFRLTPNITLVVPISEQENNSLINLNSSEDFDNILIKKKVAEQISGKKPILFNKTISRHTINLNKLMIRPEKSKILELINQKHYFLAQILLERYNDSIDKISLSKLLVDEFCIWKSVCPLIAYHIAKQWDKSIDFSEIGDSEVKKFILKYKKKYHN